MSEPTEAPPPPEQPSSWQTPPPPTPAALAGAPVEAGPAPGVAYADLGIRIVAYIIDSILLGVVTFVFILVLAAIIFASMLAGGAILAIIGFVILAILVLLGSAVYFVYTWTTMRASPGQKILNLETVNAADGATLTRDQAVRRWAFLFGPQAIASVGQLALSGTDIAALGSLLGLLSFGYAIYLLYTANKSTKRQGYHDVQSGTVVVKRLNA